MTWANHYLSVLRAARVPEMKDLNVVWFESGMERHIGAWRLKTILFFKGAKKILKQNNLWFSNEVHEIWRQKHWEYVASVDSRLELEELHVLYTDAVRIPRQYLLLQFQFRSQRELR